MTHRDSFELFNCICVKINIEVKSNSHVSVVKSLSKMLVISEKFVDFDPVLLEQVSEFDSDDKSTNWILEEAFLASENFLASMVRCWTKIFLPKLKSEVN